MTYLRSHNLSPARRARRILAWVVVVVVVVFVSIQMFAPHFFPAVFTAIAKPFWRVEFTAQSGGLRSATSLIAENEDLRRQITENETRLATVSSLEAENAELKDMLGRASSTPRLLAAVLMRPPLSQYDELIIDVGADHNISTTTKVYAPGNILIGRVVDVLGSTARVTLFSSPGEKYDVLIGNTHISATAVGRGGGQYSADLPRDAVVREGDIVSAPSLNDRAFGIVSTILADPANPFETILFAPPVNIYQLSWVLLDKDIKDVKVRM